MVVLSEMISEVRWGLVERVNLRILSERREIGYV